MLRFSAFNNSTEGRGIVSRKGRGKKWEAIDRTKTVKRKEGRGRRKLWLRQQWKIEGSGEGSYG